MEELKACPFCGGKGQIEHDAKFNPYCEDGDCIAYNIDMVYSTIDQAINAWNNRVEPSAPFTCDLKKGEFKNGRRG